MVYNINRPVMREYIPLSDKLERQLDREYKAKHGGKGWHGDTPGHKAAATKRKVAGVSKSPQIRKEKDWKKVAKKELEKELGVKTEVSSYAYYEELGALALESKTGAGSNGEREWIVFENAEAAEDVAKSKIKEDLENEPYIFNQGWLLSQIDEEAAELVFRKIYDESNREYAEGIMDESSEEYTNRLAEEMVERGIISEDEGRDEDFELESKIDLFVENITQDQIDEGSGGYEHYKLNFGDDEARKIVMQYNLIDEDAAAEDAINTDGLAHFLDNYDGSEVELPSGAIAYGTN